MNSVYRVHGVHFCAGFVFVLGIIFHENQRRHSVISNPVNGNIPKHIYQFKNPKLQSIPRFIKKLILGINLKKINPENHDYILGD